MSATYTAAATLPEALSALAGGARPVAGGTDLVVGARQGKAPLPDALVAIHGLAELRGIATRPSPMPRRSWAATPPATSAPSAATS
jgi:CO/xanthine dehydrogenase FAD-binding subunit